MALKNYLCWCEFITVCCALPCTLTIHWFGASSICFHINKWLCYTIIVIDIAIIHLDGTLYNCCGHILELHMTWKCYYVYSSISSRKHMKVTHCSFAHCRGPWDLAILIEWGSYLIKGRAILLQSYIVYIQLNKMCKNWCSSY